MFANRCFFFSTLIFLCLSTNVSGMYYQPPTYYTPACYPICYALPIDPTYIPRYSVPIKVDPSLQQSIWEQQFVNNRYANVIIPAIKNFTQQNWSDNTIFPTISIAGSGGGYRALISFLGFLTAAYNIGLLNTVKYFATCSGSTWLAGTWLSQNLSLNALKQILIQRTQIHFYDPRTLNWDDIEQKLQQIQTYRAVQWSDLWGSIVADRLMGYLGYNAQQLSFQNIRTLLNQSIAVPFPLFSTVCTSGWAYPWAEVNPFTMGGPNIGGYIPTCAFGSLFSGGYCTNQFPEESLGSFMGIFGSAYSISVADALSFVEQALREILIPYNKHPLAKAILEMLVYQLTQKLIEYCNFNTIRLLPSFFNNFTFNMPQMPLGSQPQIGFVDAGMSTLNIPIPELFNLNRNPDIIFVCDDSSDAMAQNYPEMQKAKQYALSRGIKFPPVPPLGKQPQTITDPTTGLSIAIFKDPKDPKTTVVVYVANEVDESTFKFCYTPEEFEQVFGYMEQKVSVFQNVFAQVITDKINALNPQSKKQKALNAIKHLIPCVP